MCYQLLIQLVDNVLERVGEVDVPLQLFSRYSWLM